MPARTILELARVAEEEEIIMETVKENNQVIFSCGDVQLVSRVLEGNFPDVDKIIPQSFKTEAIIDREKLAAALRVAGIFARENSNIVKFMVHGSQFIVKAQAAQTGENESEIEIEKEGEDGEIAFNYKFVQDFLGSVREERIRLKINDNLSPGVWMGEKDKSLIHLIMPVRV
ncbi:MAG: polymerase III subunit beta protein [Candidatus Amesbacteria bacterium GW2011_GWA2_47_70]|nr:MAG: polymerase III subunit beta protein [Candidatus Amesbacteria bacterium GW2011_GWA2_47_70]